MISLNSRTDYDGKQLKNKKFNQERSVVSVNHLETSITYLRESALGKESIESNVQSN